MRRGAIAGLVSTAVVAGLVVGASVVWPGLDAQETPPVDTSAWALQTGDGRRYARVNTAVGELDTVRAVSNPDAIVQSRTGAYVFSDSYSTLTRIDAAMPADLDDEALRSSASTPPGTTQAITAGDRVVYLTDAGTVFTGLLSEASARPLEPFPRADDDAPRYTADAVALDRRGMLFAYSAADGSVIRYDLAADTLRARDPLAAEGLDTPALSAAGDAWVLVDTDDGQVWRAGGEGPEQSPSTGALVVGRADADGDAVYLADEVSLIRVPADGSAIAPAFGTGATVLGIPAQPTAHRGTVYAAWLGRDDAGGTLWSSTGGPTALDYAGAVLPEQRRPVFVAGEDAAILNETRSGWAWTVPDGALVPSSQQWSLDDRTESDAQPSEEQLAVQLDPKPPVAVPDAFGVRPGALAPLPVLLNDHDPNEDVLSIDPTSVTGLDPGFGTVSITDDGQRLAVRVAADAQGTATFSYAVTDGTAEGGLLSPPATVTLTVTPDADNRAPEWCGVEGCLVPWPQPEVARGGTITVPVLSGWVDPDGDPLLLAEVTNPGGVGRAAATPAGEIVYQHSDDGSGAESLVELQVTVADTRGATTTRPLLVRVSPQPRIRVQSFAVVDVLGALSVDVAPHVTGTTGRLSLESVRVLDDAAATATVVGGGTVFDFAPREPGTYRVDFTVTDGASSANGSARITVVAADAPAELATSPVVAFVRPQEDASLDVFEAVSNPTRRVLLLSDVVAVPDPDAVLSVDAVGQNHLRVSGSTATGVAGRLGVVRYTVSDGTEDEGSQVQGEATVYLLPPAAELAPIAVDDTVVVRAGAQIDVPILDNDISPAGGRPLLNPASVVSSTPDALAFGSGTLLRYLAPETPGDYTVDYEVFTAGAPSLADTATVRIRVLDDEVNRAPTPETLEGRVLSGQSTTVPFESFGADPDGDVVVLDRIVEQPDRGTAAISADGTGIVYTSIPGDSGQVSFLYRVVDGAGGSATARVRIGVLDDQSNPSPVTYTDYVQVQAGSSIRVSPLANDIDPTGGSLRLTDVRPDVPELLADGTPSPDHARLTERLRLVDDAVAVVDAGEDPGTMAFLYDVESSTGNTGRGLLVVRVVRESVPDHPVVVDTLLTAETREDFRSGVDVLTGKATWSSGEVSGLTLSAWGEPRDLTVSGRELSGPLPATTRIVPFAVTGDGPDGPVTTYAFLRVPGDDDLALALRAGTPAREVDELDSVVFDVAPLIAKPRGSRIEVGAETSASGVRAEASCVAAGGTEVRYDAGSGAPWTDACRVPVRLEGQEDWTIVSIPIAVRALAPQPELTAASLTVGPGETARFDLRTMTRWQLREDWDGIAYALAYSGSAFEVSSEGSIVTVTGADRARPATEEAAIVSVTSHPDVAPVRLILRVGAAPSTQPAGGSVTRQCSQAAGSSCVIAVAGAPGEINPLPRTPLEVVEVRPTGVCTGVSFSVVSAGEVQATWAPDAPGATCTAAFSLRDAQGRRTSGERDGRLLLDLQGYPRAPAGIAQTGFANGSITLRIDPGEARQAYPALGGFVVRSGGSEVARCGADGVCPQIAAPNGEQREYVATAVNAVGESRGSVRTVAWAYDAPGAPSQIAVRPVVTSGEGGVVAIRIDGVDPGQTGTIEITSPTGERQLVPVRRNQTSVEVSSYRVGSNTATPISITPYSRFDLPPGLGGSPAGATVTVSGNGIGAPRDLQLTLSSAPNGDGTSTVTARAVASSGGDGSTTRYAIVREGMPCTVAADGETATFTGLTDGEEHRFTACAESIREGISFGRTTVTQAVRAEQSRNAPRGYTFVVDATPDVGADRAQWIVRATPTSTERVPNRNDVEFSGYPSTVFGRDPGMQVRYVHQWWGTATDWGRVAPASSSAPYQVQASWSAPGCVGGSALAPVGSSSTAPSGAGAAITFGNAGLRYYDATGAVLPHTADSWAVPVGAVRVDGIAVRVDWSALSWGLSPASATFSAPCDPNDPPPAP